MLNDERISWENETIGYRLKQKILRSCTKRKRQQLDAELRDSIKSRNFTVISQNCLGGVLYHCLGMKFLSPTINCCFDGPDFIRFAQNLPRYLEMDMVEVITDKKTYPVGRLDDVYIYFVHYHTFKEAKQKWDARKKRINYDNIVVIGTDRDGMLLDNGLEEFDKIPYRKIMYTAKKYEGFSWVRHCKCWNSRSQIGIITAFINFSGMRYFEKYADLRLLIDDKK